MEAPPSYSCGNFEEVPATPTVAKLTSDCGKSKHARKTDRRTFETLSNLAYRIKDRYNHHMQPKPSIVQVYDPPVRCTSNTRRIDLRPAHFPWLIIAEFSSTVYIGGKVQAHKPWKVEMYLKLVDLPGQLQRGISLERLWYWISTTRDSETDQRSGERIVLGWEKRRLQCTSPSRWYYQINISFPKEDHGWLERVRPLDLISWTNLDG
jgi:hypothetical protein